MKYWAKTIMMVWVVLGASPALAQSGSCETAVPPFSANGVDVTHSFNENVMVRIDNPSVPVCLGSGIFSPPPHVHLGYWVLGGPIVNPFIYELQFSKPVLSFEFFLTTGQWGENFIFEAESCALSLVDVMACFFSIDSQTIYLGVDLNTGSGHFRVQFSEPITSVIISGNGESAGSSFKICSNSIEVAPFYAGITAPTQGCSKDSVLFTAYIGGQEPHPAPYTFSYTVNGGAVQTASTAGANESVQVGLPQTPGSYTYELLSVTDANGNSVNITCNNTQTVTVQQPPVAQFTASPSSGMAPLQVNLNNQSTNATQYEWLLNNTPITPQNNTITLQDTGTYQITLIASNALGCTDTTVQTVHVLEQLQVTIPNVFTPNNDDVNDWFGFTANVEADASLVILNRWGGLVFEKSFVTNAGSYMELWDGTSTGSVATPNSVPVSDGVYFYKVVLSGEGWEETFVGNVSLRK